MGPAALADWWEPGGPPPAAAEDRNDYALTTGTVLVAAGGRRLRRPRIADRLVPGAVAAAAYGVAGLLPSVATSRDCVPGRRQATKGCRH